MRGLHPPLHLHLIFISSHLQIMSQPSQAKWPKTEHSHPVAQPKLLTSEEKEKTLVVTQMSPDGFNALMQFARTYCPEMKIARAVTIKGLPDDKAEALKTLLFKSE